MEIIIFPSFPPGSGVGKCPIYFHITQLKRGYNLQQIFEGDVKQIPEKGHQSQPLHMIIHNCFDQPFHFIFSKNHHSQPFNGDHSLRSLVFPWSPDLPDLPDLPVTGLPGGSAHAHQHVSLEQFRVIFSAAKIVENFVI